MSSVNHCLICCSEVASTSESLSDNSIHSTLDKHLQVVFLLRKVLEVPVKQLTEFLHNCPSMESWVQICKLCAESVNQCKIMYELLMTVNRKWLQCKAKVIKTIKNTTTNSEHVHVSNDKADFDVVVIPQKCRDFAANNKYENTKNPFIVGDSWANELAKQITSLTKDVKVEVPEYDLPDPGPDNFSGNEDDESWWDSSRHSEIPSKLKETPAKMDLDNRKLKQKTNTTLDSNSMFQIKCPVSGCSQTFQSTKALGIHRSQKHTAEERSLVPKHAKIYECKVCGKLIKSMTRCQEHQLQHDSNMEKSFICNICGKAFVSNRLLKQHQEMAANCKRLRMSEDAATVACKICGNRYSNRFNLLKHIREIHEKLFKLTCEHCGKGMEDNGKLKKHLAAAHNIGDFPCNEPECGCGKVFGNQKLLDRHVLKAKKSEPVFICYLCGKAFYLQKYLNQHEAVVHQGKKYVTKKVKVKQEENQAEEDKRVNE